MHHDASLDNYKNGTPHNTAKVGDIAKTVLMPGDPLRAKFIAENYLEGVKQFNAVRNMFGFTGTYKGKPVSIMMANLSSSEIISAVKSRTLALVRIPCSMSILFLHLKGVNGRTN